MSEAPHSTSYDAVVIGAGAIGLCSAWRLAQAGASVAVLDRGRAGSGASGVAAGMLAPVTEADFGEGDLLRLNLLAASGWPGFAAEVERASGVDVGHAGCGAVVVAADRDDAEELRRLHDFQRRLGLDAEWLPPSRCRAEEPALAPRIGGGILAPQDARVDPAALVRALHAAVLDAGGEVHEGAAADRVLSAGGRVAGVETGGGARIEARTVVLAAGCWSGGIDGLPPDAAPGLRPVKGQILELAAAEPLVSRIVRTPRCYVVDRGDGRVIIGATMEERGFDDRVTAEGVHRLLEAAWEVLPEIWELELRATRAGLRPGTPDNLPLVGGTSLDGLLVATGHHRNGVLLAPVTGAAVAALAAGGRAPEELRALAPERLADREGAPA